MASEVVVASPKSLAPQPVVSGEDFVVRSSRAFSSSQSIGVVDPDCYPNDGRPKYLSFINKAGLRIRTYSWEVEKPVAALVIVHGLQMHCRFEFLTHDYSHFPFTYHLVTEGGPFAPRSGSAEKPADGSSSPQPARTSEGAATRRGMKFRKGSHEHNSHICVYKGSWVEHFNSLGISVFGLDQQSFGLAEGWRNQRSNVEKFDDFADDVIAFLDIVSKHLAEAEGVKGALTGPSGVASSSPSSADPAACNAPSTAGGGLQSAFPLYLLGISMGGCVCVRTIELLQARQNSSLLRNQRVSTTSDDQRLPVLKGCVLLAPMLSMKTVKAKPLNRLLLPMSKIISTRWPNAKIGDIEKNKQFPWIDSIKRVDPFVTFPGKVPARLAMEMFHAVDRALTDSGRIPGHLRFLVFHSKADTMVAFEGSDAFVNEKLLHVPDRTLIELRDSWHYLVMEPGNRAILEKIVDWIFRSEGRSSISAL